jgi:2-C-methyl-D-erythritol 4-phosphate cytidylyltransferase
VTAILPLPVRFADCPDAVLTPVAGQSPLVRVVGGLAPTADVVVAAAEPLVEAVRETLDGQGFSSVRVVSAGESGGRAECLAAGLAARDRSLAHVLVHDIEWPVFSPDSPERVLAALRSGAVVAVPVAPVTDSVKAVDERGTLLSTVDRAQLRTLQYPRGFDAGLLAELVSRGTCGAFDELEAAMSRGVAVTAVDGDADALSAELPRDARYLAAVIGSRRDSR